MSIVEENFSTGALAYDDVVRVQPLVASRLASRLQGNPSRILEIGCGTGGLSQHLAKMFPNAELILTDIAIPMLEVCRNTLGGKGTFRIMDGEKPDFSLGKFDLIVSSMAMQWFRDLPEAIRCLVQLLSPKGKLVFATLGNRNFHEWQNLLKQYGSLSGLHQYPEAENFPWPIGFTGRIDEEFVSEHHANGAAFLKALKAMGANTPREGYKPLSAQAMKRLISASAKGFTVTYHILYGSLTLC